MMNGQKSKIFEFSALLANAHFFTPLILRKAYKRNFSIKGLKSNYLKRSTSRVGLKLWSIIGSKQANLSGLLFEIRYDGRKLLE